MPASGARCVAGDDARPLRASRDSIVSRTLLVRYNRERLRTGLVAADAKASARVWHLRCGAGKGPSETVRAGTRSRLLGEAASTCLPSLPYCDFLFFDNNGVFEAEFRRKTCRIYRIAGSFHIFCGRIESWSSESHSLPSNFLHITSYRNFRGDWRISDLLCGSARKSDWRFEYVLALPYSPTKRVVPGIL